MPTHDILPGVNALGCGFNPFDTAIEGTKRRQFAFDYAGDENPYSDASAAGRSRRRRVPPIRCRRG